MKNTRHLPASPSEQASVEARTRLSPTDAICVRSPRRARLYASGMLCVALLGVEACAEGMPEDAGSDESGASAPGAADLSGAISVRRKDAAAGPTLREYRLPTAEHGLVMLKFDKDPEIPAGSEINLWGTWTDDATFQVTRWEHDNGAEKRIDAPLSRPRREHRLVVIGVGNAEVTGARATNVVDKLRTYLQETTRGFDTFKLVAFRSYASIAFPTGKCTAAQEDSITTSAMRRYEAEGNSPSSYDHLAVVGAQGSCMGGWAASDMGSISNTGQFTLGRSSIHGADVFNDYWLAHELGHALGLDHARSADCGSVRYKARLEGCTMSEYGDENDPMGYGERVYYNTPAQRFSGWIAPQRVVTAGGDGTFSLLPSDDTVSCGIQAVRVPVSGEPGVYFYLEYRKARSTSTYAGTGALGTQHGNAVLVTRAQDNHQYWSNTTRLEPGTSTFEGARQGIWYGLGSTGVSVRVENLGGSAARVTVRAPSTGSHRDDSGGQVTKLSDGSFGVTSCGTTSTTCTDVAENSLARFSCASGKVVRSIKFASYGTPNGTCGSYSVGSCNASSSVSKVSQACLGKSSCEISASNAVFSDPCGGVLKRLKAEVVCGQ